MNFLSRSSKPLCRAIATLLTDEDMEIIKRRVTSVVNEELLSALVVGQQMPEIFELANEMPAHDDYTEQENRDSTKNVYAPTEAECREKLAALVQEMRAEMGTV